MKRIRLAWRRRTVGLSQEALAEQLGVDRTTVIRWERGQSEPQPWHRPNLAMALKVSVEELSVLLDSREFLVPLAADVPAAGDSSPLSVEIITSARDHYEKMYRNVGGIPVRPRIESFLDRRVVSALPSIRDNQAGRSLRRAAASLIAVAGICAYDAEQHQAAEGHFNNAFQLARASDDLALSGYVTALMANQALCLGKHRAAILHVEGALQSAGGSLSAALQTDLYSMQAKAHAQLGAYADCRRQMRSAEHYGELINPADEPKETSYVHPGLLELKSAESLLRIGELGAAQAFAETSIRLGPDDDPRGRFYSHATLAIILAEQRKVEDGLFWARAALTISQGMESQRVREKLGRLARTFLHAGDSPEVQGFLAHVRYALGITS